MSPGCATGMSIIFNGIRELIIPTPKSKVWAAPCEANEVTRALPVLCERCDYYNAVTKVDNILTYKMSTPVVSGATTGCRNR